jgi:5-methylcytosine-specific restriction endonuclease McrA
MKKCEYCENYHSGEYGSGRFCSSKCARGFSTRDKRKIINEKVRKKLTKETTQQRAQRKVASKHSYYKRKTEATSLYDMSKRTMVKVLRRMKLPCSYCGWFVNGVVGDIHHITPRKDGGDDSHKNLTYICPNCHRCAHSGIISPNELITLEDYIGDTWKEYYYVNNVGLRELD